MKMRPRKLLRTAAGTAVAIWGIGNGWVAASTLTWDPLKTGTASGGGTGDWGTTNNWFKAATGDVSWSSATPDDAVFGGSSGTVTLKSDITVNSITYNSVNYVIDLGGFNLTQVGVSNGVTQSTVTNS